MICLLLYILAACTLLSRKVEQEMRLQAEITFLRFKGSSDQPVTLPKSVLFSDEWGIPHLYKVEEGTGWESGQRVEEVLTDFKIADNGSVQLSVPSDLWIIASASRRPVPGEAVDTVKPQKPKSAPDQLLFIYPGGIPSTVSFSGDLTICTSQNGYEKKAAFPGGFAVLEKSDTAFLARLKNPTAPYFEHRAFGTYDAIAGDGWRIYSMETVSAFWEQLPTVALCAMLILCGLVLWLYTLAISAHTNRPGRLFLFCGIASILLLFALFRILPHIELPSAMLPAESILDFRHYAAELQTLRSGLAPFSDAARRFAQQQREVHHTIQNMAWSCLGCTALAALCEYLFACKLPHRDARKA